MGKRAAATEETRRRILEATRALHGEVGVAVTSYEDIAARAGVGVGTVYRHFPSLDELIPACGALTMGEIALPDPREVPREFGAVQGRLARIRKLVADAFGIYERGAAQLQAARRERDLHPVLEESARALDDSLDALVDAALIPLDVQEDDRRVARGMVDLGTWRSLRDQGLSAEEAVDEVASMLAVRLNRPV